MSVVVRWVHRHADIWSPSEKLTEALTALRTDGASYWYVDAPLGSDVVPLDETAEGTTVNWHQYQYPGSPDRVERPDDFDHASNLLGTIFGPPPPGLAWSHRGVPASQASPTLVRVPKRTRR